MTRTVATIIGRWSTEKALLQTVDGAFITAGIDASVAAEVDVGGAAWVDQDDEGNMLAWGPHPRAAGAHSDVNGRWH